MFANPFGLLDIGNGYFKETPESGVPITGNPGDSGPFENVKTYYQIIYNPLKPYPHAVMKVQPADYNDVLTLARTVSSAMTDNIAIYSSPDPALAVIDAQADELQNLITEVENGNHMKTELRNQAAEQLVVKRIVDGPHPHTAKIFIEPMGQSNLIYTVETTLTPDDESSWDEALITSNSHELLIPDRVHGQEVWYRLNASNASGAGLWSNPVSFISQH